MKSSDSVESELFYYGVPTLNDFAIKFENGMSIMEIVAEGRISRRTAYRYKAYYEELKKQVAEK